MKDKLVMISQDLQKTLKLNVKESKPTTFMIH